MDLKAFIKAHWPVVILIHKIHMKIPLKEYQEEKSRGRSKYYLPLPGILSNWASRIYLGLKCVNGFIGYP